MECAEKYGGAECAGGLNYWLNGRNIVRPSVVSAGDAAMRWYEDNKNKKSTREIKTKDITQVCVLYYITVTVFVEVNVART